MKKQPPPPPPQNGETSREKFQRLAPPRVENVIKAVRRLANLADKSVYDYTAAEPGRMSKAIREELDRMDQQFAGGFKLETDDDAG